MSKKTAKKTVIAVLLLAVLLGLYGCGGSSSDSGSSVETTDDKWLCDDLVYESSMELFYAENFSVDYYEGGYRLLTTMDDTQILVVPEGKDIPKGLAEEVIVLQEPVENIYLVSSAMMDLFVHLDALSSVRFSGLEEDGWYIEEAQEAMAAGEILYAGKYSKPDYEMIVSEECTLAIENTMIFHCPEVMEMLQDFGIPTLVEYSNYESHPLGRVEWIRFFGALLGKEEEAEEAFAEQTAILQQVAADESADQMTKQSVAFFYLTSNGMVQIRQGTDYIPKMIELAGGIYAFADAVDSTSKRSTMTISVEEFYDGAKDADYLIYNGTIDGGMTGVEQLLEKCPVLEDFQAVKEGNVWCTTNDFYQQMTSFGYLIQDMHAMLLGADEQEMQYLYRLE